MFVNLLRTKLYEYKYPDSLEKTHSRHMYAVRCYTEYPVYYIFVVSTSKFYISVNKHLNIFVKNF